MKLSILQLYSHDMNIYGDCGNVLAVQRRAERYGLDTEIKVYNQGDAFPEDPDIIIGGGGQDSGQSKVIDDLHKISPKLKALAEKNTPMLMVCGLYQLFGNFFKTHNGEILKGLGIFDIETNGREKRLIGNVVSQSSQFGTLVGYENHSGQTFLKNSAKPLAETVILGIGNNSGNNGKNLNEGCVYKSCIGTYLHGSVLPKNPAITDFLIKTALENKSMQLPEIGPDPYKTDIFIENARKVAKNLKR
ncbi:MAG: glutamine amidotransferase [Bifidobacteriaceae bacterium]|jgi:CobQ-like glutamine amidotransferase family enzyme|nr:glutamine amidotransferase [Bifidobacteriaceae bacterium]